MDAAIRLSNTVLPILYCLAAVAYAVDFLRGDPLAARAAQALVRAILTLHAAYLALRTTLYGHVPLASPAEVLTTVAFAVTGVYLLVERGSRESKTGVFMLTLALALQTASSAFVSNTGVFPAVLRSPLFALHTIAAVIGYTAFAISAVYGLLYLALYHELRRSRFGLLYDRLPALEALASLSLRAVTVGVVSLSTTIVCWALWAAAEFPKFARDPKFLLTVAVWAVYSTALASHHRLRWTGRRTIALSLFGFALLVFALVASRVLFTSFHVFA